MDNFEKNIKALEKKVPSLAFEIKNIKENVRFEVFYKENIEFANIFDKKTNVFLYDKPTIDIFTKLSELDKYSEYPYLYFYGIASGKVIKELLKNYKLERVVVFEPEIELIYIALNLIDFSKEIEEERFWIFTDTLLGYNDFVNLFLYFF